MARGVAELPQSIEAVDKMLSTEDKISFFAELVEMDEHQIMESLASYAVPSDLGTAMNMMVNPIMAFVESMATFQTSAIFLSEWLTAHPEFEFADSKEGGSDA